MLIKRVQNFKGQFTCQCVLILSFCEILCHKTGKTGRWAVFFFVGLVVVNNSLYPQVPFNNVVSTVDYPKINEWLTQVEKEMRMTLAQNLAAGVGEIKQFKHGPIDTASYLAWCDKYQAQLVVLAAQISWSEEVREFF